MSNGIIWLRDVRRRREEGDKVAGNGEKNEDDVDMEDEGSSAGDGCGVHS